MERHVDGVSLVRSSVQQKIFFCFPLLIKQDSGLVNMVVNPVDKTTTETDVFKYNKKKKLV